MVPAVLIRLRPLGPWRYGAGEGGKDRVDKIFRSDRLFSAVTLAMRQFGYLEEWLDATARASVPQVALSSLFPYQADTLFAPPPRTLWPPPSNLVTSPSPVFLSKIRWSAAQFVPVAVIDSLLTGRPILGEQWMPDPESGCLLRRDRPSNSPFRVVTRTRAAIDRISQTAAHVDSFACVEFESTSGLWCLARFADANADTQWRDKLKAAFRLLADTGFGGGRTIGWGQTATPEFQDSQWPNLLLPRTAKSRSNVSNNGAGAAYWLLSLYSPAASDSPDWSGGDYELVTRGGHARKSTRMIAEGSVLLAPREPFGVALDVAPDGHAHPIYRAGFAFALRLPEVTEEDIKPVEEPADEEAPEAKPCPEPEPEAKQTEEAQPEPVPADDTEQNRDREGGDAAPAEDQPDEL
jgi:CRISPR type III-A-associated RAMP protein Csm4